MSYNTFPPNPFPPSSGKTGDIAERVTELETNVGTLGTTKAPKTDIAPVFSAETNYNVGDLVYYDGELYECTTEHMAGEWNSEHFTATVIDEQLSDLKSGLTNATTVSSGTITAEEGVTIANYTLQKSMKTVYLYMLVKFTPTLGTGQLLCVLPSGYRAQSRLLFVGKNGTNGKFVTCETDNYGAVRIYTSSDDSSAVPMDYFLTITFFTS